MKQVRFKGKVNGKKVRGNWFCGERPNNAKNVTERLVGNKIDFFMFVIKDIKETMVKCKEI